MGADPARRALAAAGHQLVAAGFVRRVWPAGPAHVYEHITRRHRVTVVLRVDAGHQAVIVSRTNGARWQVTGEYGHDEDGQPYDIATATARGIRLATQKRSSAA
jgi:hypothetical protein